MKIKFKKKKLLFELLSGLFWTFIAIDGIIGTENVRWAKYILLLLGIFYLGTFIFNATQHYLIIENGTIQRNGIFGYKKKINLKDIIQIKEFAGDYKLITEQTVLKINTELIDSNSLEELQTFLKKLNLPADKTPFHSINSNP